MKRHTILTLFVLAALILGTLPALAQEPEKTPLPIVDSDANLEAGQAGPAAVWPGPDGFGYTGQSLAYNWVEISGSGTPITGLTDDNYLGPFPIGFSFSFYGTPFTEFYAASNGYITLGAGVSDLSNDCPLPNSSTPNNMIALLWDDLDPGDTGDLAYYQTFDPCPVGTGACLVVQYDDFCHYPGGVSCSIAGTWEAILYAETGNVILQYEDAGVEEGSGSTEGIEGNDFAAGYGLTYACDTPTSVVDGTAIEFLFPSGLMLSPDTADKQGCEDSDVTHTLTLANYTGADATFDLSYASGWPISGPASLFVANMASLPFDVVVHIPCGGVSDVATVTASGGGYTDSSTLATSSTAGGFTAWEAIDPINSAGRSRPAAEAVDGKIYLFGGEISGGREDTVEMFDPAVGEWVDMAGLMPVPASNICAAAIGTDIYIPGGYQYASPYYISDLQVYHTATDTWETISTDPYPLAAAGIGCAAVGGKLYAFGGTTGTYTNAAYVYDPAAPAGSRWTQLPGMAYTRAYLAGTAVNGKVYAVGGRDSVTADFAYVEAFDPADGLWHTLPNMSFTRGGPGAYFWGDQLVACGGGWSLYRNSCESYDTTQGYAGAWVTLPQTMIQGRRTFAYASLPEALYAVAGYNGTFLTSAERLPAFTCPGCVTDPDIAVSPGSLYAEQCPDEVTQQTLQICNEGGADLTWALTEAAARAGAARPKPSAIKLPQVAPQSLTEWLALGKPAFHVQPVAPNLAAAPETLTFYDSRAGFDADFPGLPLEGYENGSMPYGSVDSVPHPLDQYSSNLYFDPGDILPGVQFWASQTHSGDEIAVLGEQFFGNLTKGAVANYFEDVYHIMFNPPVQAAGMDLTDYMGSYSCQVDVYDEYGLVASTVSACNEVGTFLGVASDGNPIWEIVISDLAGGAEGADNVAYGGAAFDVPWLSEDPVAGTIPAGSCQDVTVAFDSTGLAAGDYLANLVIDSNDPDEPQVVVPVQLTVLQCGNTLTCGLINSALMLDPYGRELIKWWVEAVDQGGAIVPLVTVDADLTWPTGGPVSRTRLTHYDGYARFHWGSVVPGTWTIDVTNMTLAPYTFADGPNCSAVAVGK